MDMNALERLQLQVAELQAQMASMVSAGTNYRPGDRVVCAFGADRVELHARIERLTVDRDGEPAAVLNIVGDFLHLHVEPLVNLRKICGTCGDCRALNHRPGCAA